MINATRGLPVTLLCEAIDRATDLPKENMTAATARVYGRDEGGAELLFVALPMAIKPGSAVATWIVPELLASDAGFVEYELEDDSDESPVVVREDIAFRDAGVTAGQFDAAIELLTFVFEAEAGSWNIDRVTGIVTYYRPDGVTVLARWQLLDKFGAPTRIPGNAYGRRRLA